MEGHKIKIYKKDNEIIKVELDDRVLTGVVSVEIDSKYDIKSSQESIKIELTNIKSLELIGN